MKIREVKKTDARGLLDLFSKLDEETDQMLFEPGERQTSLAQQEAMLENFSSDPKSIFLVAESEDIEGFCVVAGGKQRRNGHVGSLVIGVQKSSWSRGVGSSLTERALKMAKEAGITRTELSVRTDNPMAIVLYKKFGFVVEGERTGSLLIDGELKNEYYMARIQT